MRKIEEDFEEGGIADVLVPDEDGHEYTKSQKYSLFLGAILFLAIVLMLVIYIIKHSKPLEQTTTFLKKVR